MTSALATLSASVLTYDSAVERAQTIALIQALADGADETAAQATASSTRRCYATDWRDFSAFCSTYGTATLPASPAAVRLYVDSQYKSGKSVATIGRRLAAIASYHREAGVLDNDLPTRHPLVRTVWKGIRNQLGVAPKNQKIAIEADLLRDLVHPLGTSTVDVRDRAVLLFVFSTAFRRSEICSLNVEDLAFDERGVSVTLRRSKTDQEGRGRIVAVTRQAGRVCAVAALEAWIQRAGIVEGPVFRSAWGKGTTATIGSSRVTPHTIANIWKRHAGRSGIDPRRVGAHSGRAGFITTAARRGMPEHKIMRHTGHRSVATLQKYIRVASVWVDNATTNLFD